MLMGCMGGRVGKGKGIEWGSCGEGNRKTAGAHESGNYIRKHVFHISCPKF